MQRPLWASTSTKNPSYRDVLYVEELVGPDTVNTLPLDTLRAMLDHGQVRRSVNEDLEGAQAIFASLAAVGIELDAITTQLQVDGIASFAASYDRLLGGVEGKLRLAMHG